LRRTLMTERDRWPLWLAVALGVGAGLYFALPVEPPLALGWAALVLGLAAAAITIRWRWSLGLVAALLLGFGLARLREAAVATPVLDHAVVAHLTGRIVSLEPRERGVRVVLDEVRSGALPQPPRRIRVALRAGGDFRPGQWLSSALGSKYT
jgi:competence protein ComEC